MLFKYTFTCSLDELTQRIKANFPAAARQHCRGICELDQDRLNHFTFWIQSRVPQLSSSGEIRICNRTVEAVVIPKIKEVANHEELIRPVVDNLVRPFLN